MISLIFGAVDLALITAAAVAAVHLLGRLDAALGLDNEEHGE